MVKIRINELLIVILLQIALISVIIINSIINIAICRQILSSVYLLFIPGYLLLTILKIDDDLNVIEKILYSIGLSLFFLIFNGFILIYIEPLFNISKPFFEMPVITTICITTTILCVIYIKTNIKVSGYNNKLEYNNDISESRNKYLNLYFLFRTLLILILIILLSFLGVYLLNYYSINIIILALIILILTIPFIAILSNVKQELYPFLIIINVFILLSYNILFSKYMIVTDNMYEIYFIKLSKNNGFWVNNVPSTLNTMFSIISIPIIISRMANIDIISTYKLLSLLSIIIPIGLYEIYKKLWDPKIAFLASFLFTNMFTFFAWCAVTLKMLFAGIFLVLILITAVKNEIDFYKRKLLFLIFTFSLIISHYGTSYIFMLVLIVGTIIIHILKSKIKIARINLLHYNFVITYIALTLAWYIFITSGSTFEIIVGYTRHVINNIYKFIIPTSTVALVIKGSTSITIQILKILYIILATVTTLGLLSELIDKTQKRIKEFHILSSVIIIFIFLNYLFASGGYIGRIWYVSYILLSPYFILGSIKLFDLSIYLLKYLELFENTFTRWLKIYNNEKLKFTYAILYLLVFVLFNSGFASAVFFKDYGPCIYLSKDRILKSNNIIQKEYFYRRYVVDYDISGAKWLSKYRETNFRIYCDNRGFQSLCSFGAIPPPGQIKTNIAKYHILKILTKNTELKKYSYIYLRYFNVAEKVFVENQYPLILLNTSVILKSSNNRICKIYTNGGSKIYYIN